MNVLADEQRARILALLQSGKTLRRIEELTGHRRETIALYGRRAGLLGEPVVALAARREPESMFDVHAQRIAHALDNGRSLRDIHAELVREFAVSGSYSALKRYVRVREIARGAAPLLAA